MWRISLMLEDTCVYVGQKITLAGSVRATIGRIFVRERKVTSGYVSAATKTIFRSESARYNLFIQMAKEMWEFDEDGELYYEKALQGFLPELLRRWKEVPTNHVCSVILFARVHYDDLELHMLEGWPLRKDGKGRHYVDYYKVIVDLESNCDWGAVIQTLKEEFFRFQHDILLIKRPVAGPSAAEEESHADLLRDHTLLAGRLSCSHEGNILEAINLALNPFDEHYIDRDLNRTGLSIAVVTAGTGHFEVDKHMLRVTTERMIDNGIGLDLVCLTKMPLHSVPLFHFKSHVPMPPVDRDSKANPVGMSAGSSKGRPRSAGGSTVQATSTGGGPGSGTGSSLSSTAPDPLYYDDKRRSPAEEVSFYSMPHWIDCSFYNLQQDKPFRADSFVPRCKMYDIQMMGIMENQISDISIPYLDMRTVRSSGGGGGGAASRGAAAASAGKDGSSFAVPVGGGGRSVDPSMQSVDSSNPDYLDAGSSAALTPQEQRRRAREQFDRSALEDVEPALTMRPSMLSRPSSNQLRPSGASVPKSVGSERHPEAEKEGGDPVGELPGSTRRSALHSSRSQNLDGSRQPASPDVGRPNLPDKRHSCVGSTSSSATNDPPSRPLSRVGSLRSLRTMNRPPRPLEPIGKAQALVGTSDFDMADLSAPHITSPTRQDSPSQREVAGQGSSGGSTPTEKGAYRLSASWLWKSIRGNQASGGPTDESSTQREPVPLSSTAASKRIQEMLGSSSRTSSPARPLSSRQNSQTGRSPLKQTFTQVAQGKGADADDQHAPISIPATAQRQLQSPDPSGDAKIMRDVEAYEQQLEEEEARMRYAQKAVVEKQTLVNPSNPAKTVQNSSTQLLRWQHLFPRRLNRHAVKWRSMTSPACLPLTTLHLPSATDLATQWQEYPHTTSVSSETQSFLLKRTSSTHPALAVLREMTFQRLAQGFQFIVPATNRGTLNTFSHRLLDPSRFMLRHPSESFQPGIVSSGNPIFLSQSNEIHRIAYDRSSGAINVKRYLRKTTYETSPIQYECCVWPRDLPGYQNVYARFAYPSSAEYSWTFLDSLISGFTDEKFIEPLKYWRTRFVLVPTEGHAPTMRAPTGEPLSDEEVRLLGTDKLADLFNRARYKRSSDDRQPLRFLPTSLDPTQSIHDEDFMTQLKLAGVGPRPSTTGPGKAKMTRRLADLSLDELVEDMRSESGVRIEDRMWHRVLYSDTFIGAELVTWLCCNFADVSNREEAVEWGIKLQEEGLFDHVRGAHGFLDGHYFVSRS